MHIAVVDEKGARGKKKVRYTQGTFRRSARCTCDVCFSVSACLFPTFTLPSSLNPLTSMHIWSFCLPIETYTHVCTRDALERALAYTVHIYTFVCTQISVKCAHARHAYVHTYSEHSLVYFAQYIGLVKTGGPKREGSSLEIDVTNECFRKWRTRDSGFYCISIDVCCAEKL